MNVHLRCQFAITPPHFASLLGTANVAFTISKSSGSNQSLADTIVSGGALSCMMLVHFWKASKFSRSNSSGTSANNDGNGLFFSNLVFRLGWLCFVVLEQSAFFFLDCGDVDLALLRQMHFLWGDLYPMVNGNDAIGLSVCFGCLLFSVVVVLFGVFGVSVSVGMLCGFYTGASVEKC